MPVSTFIWLLITISLSVWLSYIWHSRKIKKQVESSISEAKSILNCSAEGIVTTDVSGVIKRFNLAAETLFVFGESNVIGESFLTLLPEETRDACAKILEATVKHTAEQNLSGHELMARRSDGSTFPLNLTVSLIKDQGKPAFQIMCRDISARKVAEISSLKSQRMMEFLLQTSPVVFYTCNPSGNLPIIFVSPNVKKIFGYKPEQITTASAFWLRHIHPDDIDRVHSSRLSKDESDKAELEYRLKLSDGSYRWIMDNLVTVKDDQGKPNLLVGCWTDIHDRKVAESTLTAKQEHLRISLKCARLMTWEWHINSGEITWYGNVSESLGFESERLATFEGFSEIAHPEDVEELQDAFKRCLIEDRNLDREYRVVCPDSTVRWVHLAGELINDEAGSPVRMAGVFSDITSRKQLRVASVAEKKVGAGGQKRFVTNKQI